MKKALALILALVFVFSVTACSESSNDDLYVGNEIDMEESVLLDESDIKITAKKVGIDETEGAKLGLLFENDSDTDITVTWRMAYINDYMMHPHMRIEVPAGESVSGTLDFDKSEMDMAGITEIAEVGAVFAVYDTDKTQLMFETDVLSVKTAVADGYVDNFEIDGEVAYDQDGYKLVVNGLAEIEGETNPGIVVYGENNTDKTVVIFARDMIINGVDSFDTYFGPTVLPGKKFVGTISFSEDELTESGISSLYDATFNFGFSVDDDDSGQVICYSEPHTYNFG